jgi:glutathione S-transferase
LIKNNNLKLTQGKTMITLYGKGPTRSMRALWALKEAGLDYVYKEVDLMSKEHLSDDFKSINPYQKVPVLIDGDFKIYESVAIATYVGRISGLPLVPAVNDSKGWARFDQWMSFLNCEVDAILFTIEKHKWRYDESERSESIIAKSLQELRPSIAIIEDQLKETEYLLRAEFSVVDIIAAHCLNWARARGAFKDNEYLDNYTKKLSKREAYPRELYKK